MPSPPRGLYARKGPDALTGAIVTLLCGPDCFEFKPLFTLVYAELRARKLSGGGEEMCRLRVYEKLQSLVSQGVVAKVATRGIKEYSGLAGLGAMLPALPIVEGAPL